MGANGWVRLVVKLLRCNTANVVVGPVFKGGRYREVSRHRKTPKRSAWSGRYLYSG